MEKNTVNQHITEIIKVETKFSVFKECGVELQQSQSKSLINLKEEEQILKTQLENFKKENFSLKASIQAWKTTYEEKQKELVEAELKLSKVYNTIWSQREEFGARADKFISQYGILSQWWKERIDTIFNPLLKKTDEKYQWKSENFGRGIEEMQKSKVFSEKLEFLNVESSQAESFACHRNEAPKEISPKPTNDSEDASQTHNNEKQKETYTTINESKSTELNGEAPVKLESTQALKNRETLKSIFNDNISENPKKKKVRFSKENEKIIFNDDPEKLRTKVFSIVDRETVKKANRFKNKTRLLVKGQNLTINFVNRI